MISIFEVAEIRVVVLPQGGRRDQVLRLTFDPRHDFLRPLRAVLAEALATEVDSLPVAFAEIALERVAVRAFEREAVLPQRRLSRANLRRRFVTGNVITHLSHEPRSVPANLAPRIADERLQRVRIELARQRARRVSLIGVALTLMPQHRAKATRPEWLHPRDEHLERRPFARPLAAGQFFDAAFNRRRMGKRRAFRQPLANTRRPDATRDDTDGHVEFFNNRIPKRGNETASTAAGSRLRIRRDPPFRAIERRHPPGSRSQLLLTMIRRVRLPGDNEHLADPDMLDGALRDDLLPAPHAHFQPIPTSRNPFDLRLPRTSHELAIQRLPRRLSLSGDQAGLYRRVCRQRFGNLSRNPHHSFVVSDPLNDLIIQRRLEFEFGSIQRSKWSQYQSDKDCEAVFH